MPVVKANSVDPDQMLCSAASDLSLHCLPMSHLWDARHNWVKQKWLVYLIPYMTRRYRSIYYTKETQKSE